MLRLSTKLVCVYTTFFICHLVFLNNTAVDMGAQISLLDFVFNSFGKIHKIMTSVLYVSPIFNYMGTLHTVSHSSRTFLQSHQQYTKVPINPKPCWLLLNFFFFFKKIMAIISAVRLYLVVLIWISLMISDVDNFFPIPVGQLYVFFRKMSTQSLCTFSNWIVYAFCYRVIRIPSIFCILPT